MLISTWRAQDEPSLHLIEPSWPQVATLFLAAEPATPWLSLLLDKAFMHPNAFVRRMAAIHLFDMDFFWRRTLVKAAPSGSAPQLGSWEYETSAAGWQDEIYKPLEAVAAAAAGAASAEDGFDPYAASLTSLASAGGFTSAVVFVPPEATSTPRLRCAHVCCLCCRG